MKWLLAVLAVASGCGMQAPQAMDETPPSIAASADLAAPAPVAPRVGLWIAPSLNADAVALGCAAWSGVGVDCTRAASEASAAIRVYDDESECKAGDNFTVLLGWNAVNTTTIGLHMACMPDAAPELVTRVTAHEIGHSFGLQHVADQAAVMYWLLDARPTTLTDDDRAEWARVHP